MSTTAYRSAGESFVGRRATRYGAVVAGIALAVAGAVTIVGALSVGDGEETPQVAPLDRPPRVISQLSATDTMVTRVPGVRGVAGGLGWAALPVTDTMVTRVPGVRGVAGGLEWAALPVTDTMVTRVPGPRNVAGGLGWAALPVTDTMVTRGRGGGR